MMIDLAVDPVFRWAAERLEGRYNECHSPDSGQFCSGGDSGGSSHQRTNHAGETLPAEAPQFISKDEPGHKYMIAKRNATIATATASQFAYSYGDAAGTPFV